MGTALIVSILVGIVSLAVLMIQAFFHSKYTGLVTLSWILLSSALGATYQLKESAMWFAFGLLFVALIAANVVQALLVVLKNIRSPSFFIPGVLLALSSITIAALVANGSGQG